MRTSFALLALAAVVSAGSIGKRQFPDCAMACITGADTGTCDATDNTCLCNSPAFVDSTYSCIASTCTGNDLQTAVDGAKALCAAAGVSLTQTLPAATETTPAETASETASEAEPSATEPAASGSASASVTGSASVSRTSATSRASNASSAAASGTASHSASASASATQAANSALGLASSPMLGAFAAVAGLVFAL